MCPREIVEDGVGDGDVEGEGGVGLWVARLTVGLVGGEAAATGHSVRTRSARTQLPAMGRRDGVIGLPRGITDTL